jgi:hypothetical protein
MNNETFPCNSIFASCLSNTILEFKCQNSGKQAIHFNNIAFDDILSSLFRILNGYSFSFLPFDINSLQSAISFIGFPSFSGEIRLPITSEENVSFLSHLIFPDFEHQFDISCSFIAQNFSHLSSTDFSNLTNKALEKILSFDILRLPSENFLLQKIMEFPQKMHLIKFVIFPAVDCDLFIQFVQNFNFCLVHINLLENLKKIIYFPQENVPFQRWKIFPTLLSLAELNNLIILLNSISQDNNPPIEKLQEIMFNYNEFEGQIILLRSYLQSKAEKRNYNSSKSERTGKNNSKS